MRHRYRKSRFGQPTQQDAVDEAPSVYPVPLGGQVKGRTHTGTISQGLVNLRIKQGFGSGSARIRMFLPCPDPAPHKGHVHSSVGCFI